MFGDDLGPKVEGGPLKRVRIGRLRFTFSHSRSHVVPEGFLSHRTLTHLPSLPSLRPFSLNSYKQIVFIQWECRVNSSRFTPEDRGSERLRPLLEPVWVGKTSVLFVLDVYEATPQRDDLVPLIYEMEVYEVR